MKNFVLLCGIVLTTASNFAFAESIHCLANDDSRNLRNDSSMDHHNGMFLVGEMLSGDCDDGYAFQILGIGGGMAYGIESEIEISCPGVKDLSGHYFGPKIAVAIGQGLQGGMYIGSGVCFVGGVDWAAWRGGASIGMLTITNPRNPTYEVKSVNEITIDSELKN